MKIAALTTFLLAFCVATNGQLAKWDNCAETDEYDCSNIVDSLSTVAVPLTCDSYFACEQGKTYECACENGMYYDSEENKCKEPANEEEKCTYF